jgi:hypothetical protein
VDVLTQLTSEHKQLRSFLEPMQAAADAGDDTALRTCAESARCALAEELDAHIALEEAEVFAPLEEVLGAQLVHPFREEHLEVRAQRDDVFARVDRGEAPHDAVLRLCDLIFDHQHREDLMLFASARDALPATRFACSNR